MLSSRLPVEAFLAVQQPPVAAPALSVAGYG
jgi:hypothetical protein